jgi:hypothetical protein
MYKIIGANQVEYGPITAEQLRQWIAEGRVNAQTLAQAAGETDWKPISSFPEFAASFPAPATPPLSAPLFPGAPVTSDSGRAAALSLIAGPAIGLIVTGGLGIAAALYGILSNLMGSTMRQNQFQVLEQQNPQFAHMMETFTGPVGIVTNGLSILVCIFIIFAGIKMKKLESFGLCMAASIVAMLPCCSPCCCVGLPIGIWALVMLNKSEVKAYFQ